ncbi:hypothetical protein BC833DRAFT_606573 [Globomyces pollinis-pini]|nr:hypothetical protein BC833DRAFT_606573 [Globomyces pollinis-pini]
MQDSHESVNSNTPKLIICQQPVRARCSGNGATDFRSLDPTPVLQVISNINHSKSDNDWFVAASIWSIDKNNNLDKEVEGLMFGNTFVGSRSLVDETGKVGTFFVFPNLYIKYEGIYRIVFRLIKLTSSDRQSFLPQTEVIDVIQTEPLQAFLPKNFPGKSNPSIMMHVFAHQAHDLRPRNL